MYKISISGKAKSGKNTLSNFLIQGINQKMGDQFNGGKCLAFANPIKEMAQIMFPDVPYEYFFGSSEYRSNIIPHCFKNEQPLTIREVLIDLGTRLGRGYRDDLWLDVFNSNFEKCQNYSLIIVPDVRFRNEFNLLKEKGFYQIRLKRDEHLQLNDISETEQDTIEDTEFDCIISNNSTLLNLQNNVNNILDILCK